MITEPARKQLSSQMKQTRVQAKTKKAKVGRVTKREKEKVERRMQEILPERQLILRWHGHPQQAESRLTFHVEALDLTHVQMFT